MSEKPKPPPIDLAAFRAARGEEPPPLEGYDEYIGQSQQVDPAPPQPPRSPLWVSQDTWDEAAIPARPWIAPGYLLRGAISVLAGPGSAGKSSLFVAWAVSLVFGKQLQRFNPKSSFRVATYNIEDDLPEQRRRFSAYLRQIERSPQSLMKNLAIVGPTEAGTLLTMHSDGSYTINTAAMDALEEFFSIFKPDVLMLDPLGELHSAEENDNTTIRMVMARFRLMAAKHNMAILIAHHTRKGAATPGDPDSMRGASSIVNAARIAMTLNVMSEDEAVNLGIIIENRRNYFRLDGAKSNYAPIHEAEWFERIEHRLDNDDHTVSVIPWQPPAPAATPELLDRLTKAVAAGCSEGPWSPRLGKEARSFMAALSAAGVSGRTAQKATLDALLASGNVHTAKFKRPDKGAADTAIGLRTTGGTPLADWLD